MAFSRKPSTISVEDVGFFEGAEKLLEIWFLLDPRETSHKHSEPGAKRGLRTIPRYSLYTLGIVSESHKSLRCRNNLEELLELVHCKIISHCCNDVMDAYLLRLVVLEHFNKMATY